MTLEELAYALGQAGAAPARGLQSLWSGTQKFVAGLPEMASTAWEASQAGASGSTLPSAMPTQNPRVPQAQAVPFPVPAYQPAKPPMEQLLEEETLKAMEQQRPEYQATMGGRFPAPFGAATSGARTAEFAGPRDYAGRDVALPGTGMSRGLTPYTPTGGGTVSRFSVGGLDEPRRHEYEMEALVRQAQKAEMEAKIRAANVTPERAAELQVEARPETAMLNQLRKIIDARAKTAVAAMEQAAKAKGQPLTPEQATLIYFGEFAPYEQALRGAVQRSNVY